jgi:putative colanic acid biosynthesis UDP-glucose lipid carrier transferase
MDRAYLRGGRALGDPNSVGPDGERVVSVDFAEGRLAMARDERERWNAPDVALENGARRLEHAVLKRALDFLGSLIGILLLSPFLLLVALVIVIESRGNPLFKQRRSGYRGAPFVIYKFRSMTVREDGNRIVQAVKDDVRITRFGRLMRRTSIDELPQLFNVLNGDMSLVGPRPHALAHDEYYGSVVPGYAARFHAKPGITGLAQVSGLRGQTETIEDMAARVEKDLEYIRRWSLFSDIRILLLTVLTFLFHPAAY